MVKICCIQTVCLQFEVKKGYNASGGTRRGFLDGSGVDSGALGPQEHAPIIGAEPGGLPRQEPDRGPCPVRIYIGGRLLLSTIYHVIELGDPPVL
jgi:hypothetical protein